VSDNHVDVLIVGGGLSGIGAAYCLQQDCPGKSYIILEARERIGGTWDLFRYPGIRSDSDMYTLGYSFRPWVEGKAIADGGSILKYIKDTAVDNGIDKNIRFNHCVKRAAWSSQQAQWTVDVERADGGEATRFTCNFLFVCGGYYSYAGGYRPDFPGEKRFGGTIIHPQKWPEDLAYAGKRVVVIGSGATAVTLVPAMAQTAEHVTMVQRSPTYVVSMPNNDKIGNFLRRHLPAKLAYGIVRWRNILFGIVFFRLCKRSPERMKNWIIKNVQKGLGGSFDVGTHFTPRYNPWDQRMCLVPDGDLFDSINRGKASVVTDEIETFTERGLKLRSGAEVAADIIVTATGLNLVALGGIALTVDGNVVDPGKTLNYRGTMFSGIPNFASVFGYTNASWTLKAELTCRYICRLLNHMDRTGLKICEPENHDPALSEEPWLNLSSGYIQRVADKLPKQGSKVPWKMHQNYVLDIMSLRFGSVDDGILKFRGAAPLPETTAIAT
jgi:cation diffusion facilitator CzcD-associated flavoprotein CzcO